jgi:hypothetical protein
MPPVRSKRGPLQVRRAEYRANVTRCLLNEEPCDQGRLTSVDAKRVRQVWTQLEAFPSSSAEATRSDPKRSSGRGEIGGATSESQALLDVGPRTTALEQPEFTDVEIPQELIRRSIATYPGSCLCPYNLDRGGRRCGGRSAYSRPGGYSPLCYESDVTQEMVKRFREGA